jgi:hypothetical protein
MLGISELLILFAVIGGVSDVNTGRSKAPYDTGDKAVRYALPDAHLYVHLDLAGGMASIFSTMDELGKLRAAASFPEVQDGLAAARRSIEDGLGFVGKELGLDLTQDVGSITLSLALNSKDDMQLMMRVRARFAGSKVQMQIAKQAEGDYTFKGKQVFKLKSDTPFKGMVACFPDPTTLVMGPQKLIEEVLAKGRVKATPGGRLATLSKLVDKRASAFVLVSLPEWVLEDLVNDVNYAAVMYTLQGLEYAYFGVAPRKGMFEFGFDAPEGVRQAGYLCKAAEAFLSSIPALTDAGAYGILGALPYISKGDLDGQLRELLQDEKAVLEAATWFKKRFTGKASTKINNKARTVRLTVDNPAALGGAVLPIIGGAFYWSSSRVYHDQPVTGVETDDEKQESKPAIEHLP